MPRRQWKNRLSTSELWRGWVFFGIYLVVFPILMGQIQRLANDRDIFLPIAETNVVYYFLATVLVLLLLWGFVRHSFDMLLDWLPENLFGLGTGLAGWVILSLLAQALPLPVENPIWMDYPNQFLLSPGATVVLLVVLIPVVEEILFRGLVFGTLRGYSRVVAYLCAVLAYALYCVYQWAVGYGNPAYLLLILRYLPMSLALTWCYDVGGSIWSAAALHMVINGLTLSATLP